LLNLQTGRNQINLTSLATMDWVQSVLLPLAAFATQANARLGVLEQRSLNYYPCTSRHFAVILITNISMIFFANAQCL